MNMGDKSLSPVMSPDETRDFFAIISGGLMRELEAMEPEEREKAMDALEARGVRFKGRKKDDN